MKISFHLDDHEDAAEVSKLQQVLALLAGSPTETLPAGDAAPAAPPKKKPGRPPGSPNKAPAAPEQETLSLDETPPGDGDAANEPDGTLAGELSLDEAPPEEPKLTGEQVVQIKEAARKVLAKHGEDGRAHIKAMLTKLGAPQLQDVKPEKFAAAVAHIAKIEAVEKGKLPKAAK